MGTAARVAVATGGSPVGNYSMVVFTGWDYGCLGDRATKLKQKNIHYSLQVRNVVGWLLVVPLADSQTRISSRLLCQVDLEEQSLKKRAATLTLSKRIILYSLRVCMGLLTLALILGAFYGIFLATIFSQVNDSEDDTMWSVSPRRPHGFSLTNRKGLSKKGSWV